MVEAARFLLTGIIVANASSIPGTGSSSRRGIFLGEKNYVMDEIMF
jgi:hypothetical protein